MIEVYLCRMPDKRGCDFLVNLLPLVSVKRQSRIKKFKRIDDAFRSLISELLVCYVLCSKYHLKANELEWETNEYGKPFFPQYPFFHFNVSHSGQWVVCAVHDKPIGADIEQVLPIHLQLGKDVFTVQEYRYIVNGQEDAVSAFYDIWTLKESYVKACGKGLFMPLHSFNVNKRSLDEITLTEVKTGNVISEYICKQYSFDCQYKLSVCAKNADISQFKQEPAFVSFSAICNI